MGAFNMAHKRQNVLLVCLIETALNQGKNFVVSALWNSKKNFGPALGFKLCIPALGLIRRSLPYRNPYALLIRRPDIFLRAVKDAKLLS